MSSVIFQVAVSAIGGCFVGILVGWFIQAVRGKRRISELTSAAELKFDAVVAQRNEFASAYSESRIQVEELEAASASQRTEFDALRAKSKQLAKNVTLLRKEREHTKTKLGSLQNALVSLKKRTTDLQTEFHKTRDFYKRELLKSMQKRKQLEEDIVKARAEQDAFAKAVEASTMEHGSEENMVIAAQLRLGQLEVLERNVNKLEAENEELRDQARQSKQAYDAREQELAELEELRVNNRQLVQAVETLEDSRRKYEADAERFRQQADQSEKLSDTLRMKLDDLEKNFADMEEQQDEAIADVRKAAVVPILRKQG